MSQLNWREVTVLSLLSDGTVKRISGSGAGPVTLDSLVAKGLVVHAQHPTSKADGYQITTKGDAALKRAELTSQIDEPRLNLLKSLD